MALREDHPGPRARGCHPALAGKREQGWSVQAGLSLKVVAGSWERAEDPEWNWGGVLGSPVP